MSEALRAKTIIPLGPDTDRVLGNPMNKVFSVRTYGINFHDRGEEHTPSRPSRPPSPPCEACPLYDPRTARKESARCHGAVFAITGPSPETSGERWQGALTVPDLCQQESHGLCGVSVTVKPNGSHTVAVGRSKFTT